MQRARAHAYRPNRDKEKPLRGTTPHFPLRVSERMASAHRADPGAGRPPAPLRPYGAPAAAYITSRKTPRFWSGETFSARSTPLKLSQGSLGFCRSSDNIHKKSALFLQETILVKMDYSRTKATGLLTFWTAEPSRGVRRGFQGLKHFCRSGSDRYGGS